jgi:hypothetical protein
LSTMLECVFVTNWMTLGEKCGAWVTCACYFNGKRIETYNGFCINMKILCPQRFERAHSGCLLVIMGAIGPTSEPISNLDG